MLSEIKGWEGKKGGGTIEREVEKNSDQKKR